MRGAGSGQNCLIMLLMYLFIFAWIKHLHPTKSKRYAGDPVKSFIQAFLPRSSLPQKARLSRGFCVQPPCMLFLPCLSRAAYRLFFSWLFPSTRP